ncbi:MAG: hypothetical protein R6W69_11310 [Anaerolineales bacterium]
MKTILNKTAAALAFIIGAMAVFAGGQVLLGSDPGYYVIDWLPVYNYTLGVITVFTTAALIWTNSRLAFPAALATLGVHTLVMVILQIAYRDVVAMDSTMAMTIRMTAWLIILGLMFFARRNKEALNV